MTVAVAAALAVAGASLAAWGPTLIGTSTAALTAPHRGDSVRPGTDRGVDASKARTTREVRGSGAGRGERADRSDRAGRAGRAERAGGADRGTRTAPSPLSGAPDEQTEASTSDPEDRASTERGTAAPAPEARDAGSATGGLGDVTFYGPNAGAARAAAQPGVPTGDAALLAELAKVPTATWLGQWSGDVASTVRRVVADAGAAGGVPVFVVYNVPGRDCGGHSAGGENSAGGYARWVQGIADGIGTAEAVVVVEPDALAQLCGDAAERFAMLGAAVDVLERNPGTHTYLDAGHADWIDAATMAERLRRAGAADADGFALNVSNFGTTAANVAYGRQLSALLDGAHFVVDTSRNGNGPGSDWCNPPGRAVGERPTARTGQDVVDAYLWIKTPGESDGTCNGGASAGVFWPEYALGLLRGAA